MKNDHSYALDVDADHRFPPRRMSRVEVGRCRRHLGPYRGSAGSFESAGSAMENRIQSLTLSSNILQTCHNVTILPTTIRRLLLPYRGWLRRKGRLGVRQRSKVVTFYFPCDPFLLFRFQQHLIKYPDKYSAHF